MRLNFRLIHKGIILVSVPLVFELIFVGTLFNLYLTAEAEAARSAHAKKIYDTINGIVKDVVSIYRSVDGEPLRHPGFNTNAIREKILYNNQQLMVLRDMVKDDPRQLDIYNNAEVLVRDIERIIEEIGEVYDHGTAADVDKILRKTRKELQSKLKDINMTDLLTMAQEQQELGERAPQAAAEFRERIKALLAGALVFNVCLAMLLAVFFSRGISKRIAILSDNSMRLAEGKPLHQPIQGSDEIAHLDKVFHSMADALAEAERSKQEVIGMVTHDLKTPLTTLSALLEMLEDGILGTLNEEGVKGVAVANRNVMRMNWLIRDLLDIEKIRAGKLTLVPGFFSVAQLMEDCAASVQWLALERQIQIIVDADDIDLFADSQRLQQVLINLLSNAIKFSPGGSTIRLSAKRDADNVHFSVQDQGRGIPKQMLAAVFERFEQTQATDATIKGGSGLGLAICKALVELHGGHIGVTSEEGNGSTFYFSIPLRHDAVAVPAAETVSHSEGNHVQDPVG